MKTHSFKANGLHLLFAFTADAPVKLLNFSFAKGGKPDPESKLTKWSRLVEVQANGRDWDDHHGNKYTGTIPAVELCYKSHRESKTPLGAKLEIVQEGGGLRVTSHRSRSLPPTSPPTVACTSSITATQGNLSSNQASSVGMSWRWA